MIASTIIGTRDRSESLRQTLRSLAEVNIPAEIPCELILVDNSPAGSAEAVVRSSPLPDLLVRSLREPQPGQNRAYNAGLAAAPGRVLLFADDVRLPRNWLEGMCRPILSGQAHAVAGGVRIAPHLERAWMGPEQRRTACRGRVSWTPPGKWGAVGRMSITLGDMTRSRTPAGNWSSRFFAWPDTESAGGTSAGRRTSACGTSGSGSRTSRTTSSI